MTKNLGVKTPIEESEVRNSWRLHYYQKIPIE